VGAKGVEAGVLGGATGTLGFPGEGRVGRGDWGHWGDWCRAFRVKVVLVWLALRSPDGAKQTRHGRQAAGPREERLCAHAGSCSVPGLWSALGLLLCPAALRTLDTLYTVTVLTHWVSTGESPIAYVLAVLTVCVRAAVVVGTIPRKPVVCGGSSGLGDVGQCLCGVVSELIG